MKNADKYDLNMKDFFKNLNDSDFLKADSESGFVAERTEEGEPIPKSRKKNDKEIKQFLDAVGKFIRSIDIDRL